jgi:MoxR-like ATPase
VAPTDPAVGLDAALIALSGRVRLREGVPRTAEDLVTELWREVFGTAGADPGKGAAPHGATSSPL